ncbi:MAG TPA: transglycosylase domain-containing protein, partial [Gemmatimonadales bacterium]|nr:transglycosylase domain-containing protein [Gemmatimonadales bacterium]
MSIGRLLAAAGATLATLAAAAAIWVARPLPDGVLDARSTPGLVLLDRDGRELRSTRTADGARRRWVSVGEMDPDLIAAFVAAEDRRFFRHRGIDARAAARAARDNLRAGRIVSGGSTLTMQLARMLRPLPRSWAGKVRQTLWALRLERHLGKQAILEQYLNRVPLGQGAEGVDAAAALYFAASAADVTLGQAATLAGIAPAPSTDNPLVSPGRAARRRAATLARLVESGYAGGVTARRAGTEPVGRPTGAPPFLAPHFTTRVVGWMERGSRGALGTWRTSLDLGLQTEIEAEVRHTVGALERQGVRHAAAVVLDNERGEILAWVGSPDFWA